MSYNEQILISINPEENSVKNFNETMNNLANRAKQLGDKVAEYTDGLFNNIKVKGESITFAKALDLSKLDEVKKKLKSISGSLNVNLDLGINEESLNDFRNSISLFIEENPIFVDVTARRLKIPDDFKKYQNIPLNATISNTNLKDLKNRIKEYYEEDKNKVPLTFTAYPIKLARLKKVLVTYFEEFPIEVSLKFKNIADLMYDFNQFRKDIQDKRVDINFGLRDLQNKMKSLGGLKELLFSISGRNNKKIWGIKFKIDNLTELTRDIATLKEKLAQGFYIGDIKGIDEAVIKIRKYANALKEVNIKEFTNVIILNNYEQVIADLKEIRLLLPPDKIEINFTSGESLKALDTNLKELVSYSAKIQDMFKNINTEKLERLSGVLSTARKRAIGLHKELNSVKDVLKGNWSASYFKKFEEKITASIDKLGKLNVILDNYEKAKEVQKTLNVKVKETGVKEVEADLQEVDEVVKDLTRSLDSLNTLDMTTLFKGSKNLKNALNEVKAVRFGENLKAQSIEAITALKELGKITEAQANSYINSFEKMDLQSLNYFTNAKKMFSALGMEATNYSNILKSVTDFSFFKASKGGAGSRIFSDLDIVKGNLIRNELVNILDLVKATTGETDLWKEAMKKVNATTNKELVAMERLSQGIKSIDFRELLNTKRFSGLKDTFSQAFAGSDLSKIKNELRSYSEALLNTKKINATEFKKMGKAIDEFTEKELANLRRIKGGMTSLGESTSKMRGLFVQLTRVFIATMYVKQIYSWADATNKLKMSIDSFKTNPEYTKIADQMENLKHVTAGAATEMSMIPAINKAMALGIDLSKGKLLELSEMTTKMSQAFGVDGVKAFKDFTEAAAKGSAIVMDNIGILLRQEEAYKRYFRTLKLSNTSYSKWLNNLTQAKKRSIYLQEALVELRKKTGELTLVFSPFTMQVNELQESWRELSLAIANGSSMSIAGLAINKLREMVLALNDAFLILQKTINIFASSDYSGRNIKVLAEDVTGLNDGMLKASSIMEYFKANFKELTYESNHFRKSFISSADAIKNKLNPSVINSIINGDKWVKQMDYTIGRLAQLNNLRDKEYRYMTQGNINLNSIARAAFKYNKQIEGLIVNNEGFAKASERFNKSMLEGRNLWSFRNSAIRQATDAMSTFINTSKKIGDIDYVYKRLNYVKDLQALPKLVSDLTAFAGGSKIKTILKLGATEGISAGFLKIKKDSLNTEAIVKTSIKKLTLQFDSLTESYKKFSVVSIKKELLDSTSLWAKSLGVGKKELEKTIMKYFDFQKAGIKVGKTSLNFSSYLIDKLAATNKQVAKLKKNLDGLLEQWIKLKRESERLNMNAFDQKQAKFVDKYRDKIKKVFDLYKQIKGYTGSTIFPNFFETNSNGKTDINSYYKKFIELKDDINAIGSGKLLEKDFLVKYKVTSDELTKMMGNFGSAFIKEYEEKFIKPQEVFTSRLKIALDKSVATLYKAKIDIRKNITDINNNTFDKLINNVRKLKRFFSQGIYDKDTVSLTFDTQDFDKFKTVYSKMKQEVTDYYKYVGNLNYNAKMESLRLAEDTAMKALEAQYSGINNKERLEKAKAIVEQKYSNLRGIEALRYAQRQKQDMLDVDRQYFNAVKELYNNANLQMTEAMKYANNDLMTSGELFYYSIEKVFDRATGKIKDFKATLKTIDINVNDLGFQGLEDMFKIGDVEEIVGLKIDEVTGKVIKDLSNAEKIVEQMKQTIPEEFRTSIYFDYHDDKFKVFKRDFAELGTVAQQKILDDLAKINPAMEKIFRNFKKPVEILQNIFEDAFKKIADSFSDLTYQMTIGLYEATQQMNADKSNEIASIQEEYAKGLITQQEYKEKAHQIDLDYQKKRENFEKEAVKSALMGLAKTFWAQGMGYLIQGGINLMIPTKEGEGAAQVGGGLALMSLAGLLGLAGGSITTNNSSAASASKEAESRGDRDRYIVMDYNLFEDELSFSRTVDRALEY